MALENRIDSLKKQHARLDQMLRAEEARAGGDEIAIHRLKQQKLAVKDQIEFLLHGAREAA
ncbi:MAG: YdcH family protein [Alphaproteobacteria bacterium]|nr:YdcH family protein [Alphaproteobacteria bacterium]